MHESGHCNIDANVPALRIGVIGPGDRKSIAYSPGGSDKPMTAGSVTAAARLEGAGCALAHS